MTLSSPTTNTAQIGLTLGVVVAPCILWLFIKFLYYFSLWWTEMKPIRNNPRPYLEQQLQILYNVTRVILLTSTLPIIALYFVTQKYPQVQPIVLLGTLAPNASMAYAILLLVVLWSIKLCVLAGLMYLYAYFVWIIWQLVFLNR